MALNQGRKCDTLLLAMVRECVGGEGQIMKALVGGGKPIASGKTTWEKQHRN